MITLITGAPGTGKSNALVSLMQELGKDRAVYVFGVPELKLPHLPLEDPLTWPDTVPDGSCIVIDEVQNVWRPRGPGQKVPEHIAKLETHRHRGLDFYIITQGPNLVDANVRALVGRHVHLRDLGVLGRWWYEWPECADNCRTGWKNAPIKKRYRLDKAAQALYKSASIHVKPIRSIPWMLAVMVIALIVTAVLGWRTYSMINARIAPPAPAPVAKAEGTSGIAGTHAAAGVAVDGIGKGIDDRIAWVPRVSSRPESAPAYDEIRKVVAMPIVVGCMAFKGVARCFTQQGTDAGLDDREARMLLQQARFNPYAVESKEPRATQRQAPESAPATAGGPQLVVMEGRGFRDPLNTGAASTVGRK